MLNIENMGSRHVLGCHLITFAFYKQFLQLSHNFVARLIKQLVLNKEQTMEMHTEDKPSSCVQCNLSFETKKDLKTHMLKHGGKKAHTCNQCRYSTIKAADMRKHMLIHSGEKPFVCKQCNYSCTQAGSLKRHMQTHSGEKPFNCTQCKNALKTVFAHADTFKRETFHLYTVQLLVYSSW